jgi:hypothetical protein
MHTLKLLPCSPPLPLVIPQSAQRSTQHSSLAHTLGAQVHAQKQSSLRALRMLCPPLLIRIPKLQALALSLYEQQALMSPKAYAL